MTCWLLICLMFLLARAHKVNQQDCFTIGNENLTFTMHKKIKEIMPQISFDSYQKKEDVRIAIIGGSVMNAAAPYYAGIAALKSGADMVYIITSASAAPLIKKFSPDLIVYPILHEKLKIKLHSIIEISNVVLIGTGLEVHNTKQMNLLMDIIAFCRKKRKPLILSEGVLKGIAKNISRIRYYESPGVVLAATTRDMQLLSSVVKDEVKAIKQWHLYWGHFVSVLSGTDKFLCSIPSFNWVLPKIRNKGMVQGEGSVLCGILASLFAYAMNTNICVDIRKWQFLQSGSAYAASLLVHKSHELAYEKYENSLETKHLLNNILLAFQKFSVEPITIITNKNL